jgi:hypothetical protein
MDKKKSPATLRDLTKAAIARCCKLGVLQTKTGLAPHVPAPVLEEICVRIVFSEYEMSLLQCNIPFAAPLLPNQLLDLEILKRVRSIQRRQIIERWHNEGIFRASQNNLD